MEYIQLYYKDVIAPPYPNPDIYFAKEPQRGEMMLLDLNMIRNNFYEMDVNLNDLKNEF